MQTARDIMRAAEAKADAIGNEFPMVIATKPCGRRDGRGNYRMGSGDMAGCWACRNGQRPANAGARELWVRELVARELRRLRMLWAGARDALNANPSRHAAAEFVALQRTVEARAAAVKAGPGLVAPR